MSKSDAIVTLALIYRLSGNLGRFLEVAISVLVSYAQNDTAYVAIVS